MIGWFTTWFWAISKAGCSLRKYAHLWTRDARYSSSIKHKNACGLHITNKYLVRDIFHAECHHHKIIMELKYNRRRSTSATTILLSTVNPQAVYALTNIQPVLISNAYLHYLTPSSQKVFIEKLINIANYVGMWSERTTKVLYMMLMLDHACLIYHACTYTLIQKYYEGMLVPLKLQ